MKLHQRFVAQCRVLPFLVVEWSGCKCYVQTHVNLPMMCVHALFFAPLSIVSVDLRRSAIKCVLAIRHETL